MYISINNSLPSINLHIDNPEDDENHIRILGDTGAVMNTGSLEYHLWVMSQCPECGKNTSYDIFHLLTALDLIDTNQNINHGKMNVVIRYKTLCIVKGRGPFILSFSIGHNVSLHCVLILPTLFSIGEVINFLSRERSCTKLNRTNPTIDLPGKGLIDDDTLNRYSYFIPSSVTTNITSTNSLL